MDASAARRERTAEIDVVIEEHLPLVRQVARGFRAGSGTSIEMNDLVQYGVMGLIDATEKYDPSKGTSFTSYARFRIKGSILDGLRHEDFVPRSVRRKKRALLDATHRAEQAARGTADLEEVAREMAVEVEDLHRLRETVQSGTLTSLEELTEQGAELEINEALCAGGGTSPEDVAERRELRDILAAAIDHLPEKERLVLSLYYRETCTMKEIGSILGVTESRVSQLHSKAVGRLRQRLARPLAAHV